MTGRVRPTPKEQMLAKLRELRLDVPEDTQLERIYTGRHQRSEGAWSWTTVYPFARTLCKDIGSQYPMWALLACKEPLTVQELTFVIHVDPADSERARIAELIRTRTRRR